MKRTAPPDESSYISTVNTNLSVNLANTEVWDGVYEQTEQWDSVSVLGVTTGAWTLTMYLSPDGVAARQKSVLILTGGGVHQLAIVSRFFRIRIHADQGVGVTGAVQCLFKKTASRLVSKIDEVITGENDAQLVRAVLTSKAADGNYVNIESDVNGFLKTSLPQSAYNEQVSVSATPIINDHFLYDTLNSQRYSTFAGSGGAITVQDSLVNIASSATPFSYAVLRSKRNLQYFPGTSNQVRFTALFDTAVVSSTQRIGLGTAGNEISVGYNGIQFGFLRAYGGKIHVVELTVTAAAGGVETATVTLNSVAFEIALTNAGGAIAFTCYELERGVYAGWNVFQIDETIRFAFAGVGAKSGTYSYSSTGTSTGTFATITTGVALTESWVYEDDFNVNPALCISLDKTKGNVYMIDFSWLGFNSLTLSAASPTTGIMEPLHVIRYPNSSTAPSVLVPHMPLQAVVYSYGTTTPLTLKSASWSGFTIGVLPKITTPRVSFSHEKTILKDEETIITAFRSRWDYNGVINQSRDILLSMALVCDGAKATIFKFVLNPTTLGDGTTTDYSDFKYVNEADALLEQDTKVITYTGGDIIFQIYMSKEDKQLLYFEYGEIVVPRGATLLITAETTGVNSIIDIAATFVSDI